MAKTTFTRTKDGQTKTRIAHTQAEAVALRFAGWKEADAAKAKQVKDNAAKNEPAKPAAS